MRVFDQYGDAEQHGQRHQAKRDRAVELQRLQRAVHHHDLGEDAQAVAIGAQLALGILGPLAVDERDLDRDELEV